MADFHPEHLDNTQSSLHEEACLSFSDDKPKKRSRKAKTDDSKKEEKAHVVDVRRRLELHLEKKRFASRHQLEYYDRL